VTNSIAERVWEYLSRQEAEADVHLRDDLRIAKLCILEAERGTPDPWGMAFWKYMSIPYPKYLGILAEREAYKRSLGPTLADQLQDPTFLATIRREARPFYSRLQMSFDFPALNLQLVREASRKPQPRKRRAQRSAA
jgi:hypothetical protein